MICQASQKDNLRENIFSLSVCILGGGGYLNQCFINALFVQR